jgi:hypothetical protein
MIVKIFEVTAMIVKIFEAVTAMIVKILEDSSVLGRYAIWASK